MAKIARKKRKKLHRSLSVFNLHLVCAIFLTVFVLNVQCEKFPNLQLKPNASDLVSKALNDIIQKFFIANNIKFDIMTFGESTNHINDIVTIIGRNISENKIPTNVKHIKNFELWKNEDRVDQSAIIFFKTRDNFQKFQLISSLRQPDSSVKFQFRATLLDRYKFFIYVQEFSRVDEFKYSVLGANVSMLYLPVDVRLYEFFITKKGDFVTLYANVLHTRQKCEVFQQEQLNVFNGSSQKWIKPLRNFDHFSNHHGCNVSIYCNAYNYLNKYRRKDEKTLCQVHLDKKIGLMNEIMELTAQRLNFKVENYTIFTQGKSNQIAINIGPFYYQKSTNPSRKRPKRDRDYLFMPIDVGYEFYILVTLNDLYSNYEKLTLPFDDATWTLFSITFGLTLAVILSLRFYPKKIRYLIVGRGVRNPLYNAAGAFFGISQMRVPKENFSRILLLLFLWFCLMFRTCYQSMMFEFMTSDMRKPLPKSVKDLLKYNYTFVWNHDTLNDLQGNFNFPPLYILINGVIKKYTHSPLMTKDKRQGDFVEMYKKEVTNTTGRKYAFFVTQSLHAYLNGTYQASLPVMENSKFSLEAALIMAKHNRLFPEVSKTLDQLAQTGIVQYLYNYDFWYLYRPLAEVIVDTRKVLSMTDLEFGFVIWLCCCPFAVIVFIFELTGFNLKLWMRRKLRVMIGWFEFFRIFRARMNVYHDRW